MTTAGFVDAWKRTVDQDIQTDPIFADTLSAILGRLNDADAHRTPLDDVITQHMDRRSYDQYDAAALHEVALLLNLGWCVITYIPLLISALADARRGGDAGSLRLPEPFTICTARDAADLQLRWAQPITIEHAALPDQFLVVSYDPAAVPLRLGPAQPAITVRELRQYGGIARCPAEADRITLLLATCSTTGQPIPIGTPTILAGTRVVEPTEGAAFRPADGTGAA
jgi:hypothetical protein